MRLIDADKLIEHFEKVKKESASLVDMAHIIGFQSVIDAQPTAYEPDKVVKQLEKHFNATEDNTARLAYHHAIKIVKGGGVNGN